MKKTILSICGGMLLGVLLVGCVFAILNFRLEDGVVLAQNILKDKNQVHQEIIAGALELATADITVEIQEVMPEMEKTAEKIQLEEEARLIEEARLAEEAARRAEEARKAEEARIAALPYLIRVNRYANCVTVYTKDETGAYTVPVKAMVCSVGLDGGTPLENGSITDKYDWRLLFGNVWGQYAVRFNGHIMFHSVPYMTPSKDTLKEGQYNLLGQPASQGCIRLAVADAKWIYDNCDKGTKVEVYDNMDPGPLGKPASIYIDPYSALRGWDPTDPDPSNPWNASGMAEGTVSSVPVS